LGPGRTRARRFAGDATEAVLAAGTAGASWASGARLARGTGGRRRGRGMYLGHFRRAGHPDHDVARRVDAVAAVTGCAAVYRHQIRSVIEDAASAINLIFPASLGDEGDDDDGAAGALVPA
jgi:hypothetical protein